jgi:hypothetical protein
MIDIVFNNKTSSDSQTKNEKYLRYLSKLSSIRLSQFPIQQTNKKLSKYSIFFFFLGEKNNHLLILERKIKCVFKIYKTRQP